MRLTAAQPSKRSQVPSVVAPIVSRSKTFPAPVEGWDAISPIASMGPKRALRLDNWFPQPSWVELRKGYVAHCDTETGAPVETVMAYQGVGGANALFAASDDTIFDVTSTTASAAVTSLANARFQYINFSTTGGHFLYCVNGADDPQIFDGTMWTVPTITGIDATDVVYVNAFKDRLFFIFNQSTEFAYLAVDSIQGGADTFELGALMTMGGYLVAMGTWSIDAGDGPDDYAVFFTSRGQAIIYRGTDPSDAQTWSLVGVYNMGPPIGRRCLTKAGADIAIICVDGVVPLSRAMIFERAAVTKVTLTQNIQRVMNQSAIDYGSNFGWQLISYPHGTRVVLNVPIEENVSQEQYVMNTLNGAWCRFTGMNFSCWELFNEALYGGGNDGVVYLTDTSGSDNGNTITADMMTAFSDYGSGQNKRWVECQPLLTTDGQSIPGLAINTDFKTNAPISIPSYVPIDTPKWDAAVWDHDIWPPDETVQTYWRSVTGIGTWASIRMAIDINSVAVPDPDVLLRVNGFNVAYETGSAII